MRNVSQLIWYLSYKDVLSYGTLEYRIDNKGHIMQIFFYYSDLIQLYEENSFLKRCV